MAWKPFEEIQKRNVKIKAEHKEGMTKKDLASKYQLSVASIVNIVNENKVVKRNEDRINKYEPVSLKPGQTIKLSVSIGERRSIRKYKVLREYRYFILMERNGIKECFTKFDVWKGIVK